MSPVSAPALAADLAPGELQVLEVSQRQLRLEVNFARHLLGLGEAPNKKEAKTWHNPWGYISHRIHVWYIC
jgi:hypothetical protein